MTPRFLQENANISGSYNLISYDDILVIDPIGSDYFVVKVQLIAPEILTNNDSVSITVTVAFNFIEHIDARIGITDGISFKGFRTTMHLPGSKVPHPNEIMMQFKPSENWQYTHGNNLNFTKVHNVNLLNLSKGISFMLSQRFLQLEIRYITVDVSVDCQAKYNQYHCNYHYQANGQWLMNSVSTTDRSLPYIFLLVIVILNI